MWFGRGGDGVREEVAVIRLFLPEAAPNLAASTNVSIEAA
jgi:hypothetical protein